MYSEEGLKAPSAKASPERLALEAIHVSLASPEAVEWPPPSKVEVPDRGF